MSALHTSWVYGPDSPRRPEPEHARLVDSLKQMDVAELAAHCSFTLNNAINKSRATQAELLEERAITS